MQSPKPAEKWMRGVQLESVRALFEHLPGVMFFAKDAQGRFMAANLSFAPRPGTVLIGYDNLPDSGYGID